MLFKLLKIQCRTTQNVYEQQHIQSYTLAKNLSSIRLVHISSLPLLLQHISAFTACSVPNLKTRWKRTSVYLKDSGKH